MKNPPLMNVRLPQLDGFRAVAVGLVTVFHGTQARFSGGFIGVDMFFVLSGFLITALLVQEYEMRGQISFSKFYLRRLLRLAPALLALLVINTVFVVALSPDRAKQFCASAASLFFVMNWVVAFSFPCVGNLGHMWSLGIEAQFYLVWPALLLAAVVLKGRTGVACLAIMLIVSCVAWRTYLVLGGSPPTRTYNGFDTRADTLFIGCLLAVLPYQRFALAAQRSWLVPASFLSIIALLATWDAKWVHLGGFTVVALSAAWIITALMAPGSSALVAALRTWPAVYIGRISYGIYLWHLLFASALFGIGVPYAYVLAAIIPLSIAAASISYSLIERPFLGLKDRLS